MKSFRPDYLKVFLAALHDFECIFLDEAAQVFKLLLLPFCSIFSLFLNWKMPDLFPHPIFLVHLCRISLLPLFSMSLVQ